MISAQLRSDLDFLDGQGFDTKPARAALNRHLAAGTLAQVLPHATKWARDLRRATGVGGTVGGQARYEAGRKNLLAQGPAPRKGKNVRPVTSGILDSLRTLRPETPGSTRLVEVR